MSLRVGWRRWWRRRGGFRRIAARRCWRCCGKLRTGVTHEVFDDLESLGGGDRAGREGRGESALAGTGGLRRSAIFRARREAISTRRGRAGGGLVGSGHSRLAVGGGARGGDRERGVGGVHAGGGLPIGLVYAIARRLGVAAETSASVSEAGADAGGAGFVRADVSDGRRRAGGLGSG